MRIFNQIFIWCILIQLFNPSISYSASVLPTPTSQPNGHIRAVHFVLGPDVENFPIIDTGDAKRIITLAKNNGFNTVILGLSNGVKFDNLPGQKRLNAWSKSQLVEVLQFAHSLNIEVVPDIALLTHQDKFFGTSNKDLLFNKKTYDPRNPAVYKKVFAYLDEVISTMHPKALHIGHDEVIGWNLNYAKRALSLGDPLLPAELFLNDTLRVHDYLKQRGVETWMWGDMLVSADEFPTMLPRHLHGNMSGYGRALRNKLPRDIVICDWHYFDDQPDFPSLGAMRSEGFQVLGATWDKEITISNFSKFSAMHGGGGMIATTWFYVPQYKWDKIENIIRTSGAAFNKDFPDAK